MAETVSLMVVPTNNADALPQVLMEHGGVWQDMSPALTVRAAESVTRIKDKIDRHLGQLMSEVEMGASFTADSAPLRAPFAESYRLLVPSSVQQVLARAVESSAGPEDVPVLRVHTHPFSEWIPWEILHDGEDFLGLRFQIARLPIVSQAPDLAPAGARQVQRIYNLLGKNVLDDQNGAEQTAWASTFGGPFPDNVKMRHAPSAGATDYPDLDTLTEALDADILHVTCHGGLRDEQQNIYWTLNHHSKIKFKFHLTTTVIDDLSFDTRPLVFGNACASSMGAGAGERGGGLVPGFGSSFFARGALNFVGTFAPITRRLAIDFAREFYRRLLGMGGEPARSVGQALLATKRHYRNHPSAGMRGDPSYLFYCLYGAPETTYTV